MRCRIFSGFLSLKRQETELRNNYKLRDGGKRNEREKLPNFPKISNFLNSDCNNYAITIVSDNESLWHLRKCKLGSRATEMSSDPIWKCP
jgi:hypothetical protein